MAEEEDTTTEDAPSEAEAPETEPTEAVAEEQVEEAPAEEAPAEEAPAEEAPAEEAPAAEAAPAAEPEEALAPKERRARARAAKAAKAAPRGPRSSEERQADRDARRAAKATSRRAGRAKATAKHKDEAHSRVPTPAREHVAGTQKVRQGVVVSDKADKTITVRIDVARRHRRYQKIVRTSQTLHAHDEANDAHIGDTVTVREARPLSRTKRWRLVGVVERAK
jgi:small subunit ribosomal protein S17